MLFHLTNVWYNLYSELFTKIIKGRNNDEECKVSLR